MAKEVFKVTVDDKEVELAVVSPNAQVSQDANLQYRTSFAKAVKAGVLLRDKLEEELERQGLWGPEQVTKEVDLIRQRNEKLSAIEKGGIKLSLAKQLALEVHDIRSQLRELYTARTALDSNTAEGVAENSKFDYLVSACTLYSDGKRYFRDLNDYYERSNEPATSIAASKLMQIIYGVDADYESSLPENQFLKKFKFVDDKLRFVDKDGNFTDRSGRKVDSEGYYLNDEGKRIEPEKVETLPFLDDEGNSLEIVQTESVPAEGV